ncbi:DUF2637 domain-containing protein [Actinoallomurus acaciae]|uniref:DUF2637 domain-containing protein n=2 Tax=Actinoallomurus acaciae TaxID=502577 RepID=A0ABV5YCR6_9ACTN
MATEGKGGAERAIRWATTVSVIVLAVIVAIISYKHMYLLVRRYGETSWTAALLPISVDGMIAASSMSLLLDSRHGRRSGLLPWTLLIIGSTASLAANVAVAEPSAVGRLIAGWPSCALIGSYELLMRQIRHTSTRETTVESIGSYVPHTRSEAAHMDSEESHTLPGPTTASSYEAPTSPADSPNGSGKSQTEGSADDIGFSDGVQRGTSDGTRVGRSRSRGGVRSGSGIQRQAWQWAVANRTPDGDLPAGKAIASEFGRSERWGRLVKQAGLAGGL